MMLVGFFLPIGLAYWVYSQRADIVAVALDQQFLAFAMLTGVLAVVVRFMAIFEIASSRPNERGLGPKVVLATFVVALIAVPVSYGVYQAGDARAVVGSVFNGSSDAPAIYTPPAGGDSSATSQGVTNVLLLGGDAGPGRWGLRTDTMILVSIDQASGRTSLISIPRNLTRLRFPPGTPLHDEFPDGFNDLANAVFPHVSTRESLMAAYARDGLQPEAVALTEAVGYSLDVEIDDYALVNMQGFLDVIDAIGGVTLELDSAIPMPGSIPGAKRELPSSLGPGSVDMDGTLAIAYVRSRSADSDYQRMGRQRQLLAALGSQVSAADALSGFSQVTGALDNSMRTSLAGSEFTDLLDRLGDNTAIVESVGLAPPLVNPGSPDYDAIRQIVAAVQRAIVSGEPSGY